MTTELDVAVIVIYSPVTMELAGKHVLVTSAAAAAVAAAFHDVSDRLISNRLGGGVRAGYLQTGQAGQRAWRDRLLLRLEAQISALGRSVTS